MTSLRAFALRCKIRHDFADMLQVRYEHSDGESYDTWVSGEEVSHRLRSEDAEQRLRGLGRLSMDDLRDLRRRLPDKGKERLRRELRDRLGESITDALGDNIIGQALSEAARGSEATEGQDEAERRRWRSRLEDGRFRAMVLALAYTQLEGSFPEEDTSGEADDWV